MSDIKNYKKIEETLEFTNGGLTARVVLDHRYGDITIRVYDKENELIDGVFNTNGEKMGQLMEYVGLLGMVSNWYYNL